MSRLQFLLFLSYALPRPQIKVKEFLSLSDLSANMSKCEIAGNGSLKGVETAACRLK